MKKVEGSLRILSWSNEADDKEGWIKSSTPFNFQSYNENWRFYWKI